MTFETIAGLAIVGAAVSTVVQFLKARLTPTGARVFVIGLSLLGATVYWFVQDTQFVPAFLSILGLANTVYLFVFKMLFEE
jgi:uncharacterized membrane protein (UPF0136 family)